MRASRFTPWLVVVTLVAAGAAAAAGYGLTAPKRYRATAQLLVSPVSASDSTFAGLDLLRDASGRRTAAETAAVLVRSPQVADAVRAQLGLRVSRDMLLGELAAHAEDASDVVDVTVEDSAAASAAQLANAFVDALIAQRTADFQSRLASAIRHDAQLLAGGSRGPQGVELARRLAVLRGFQGEADPTVRRASTAIAPTASSWPDVPKLVGIGAAAGLALAAAILLVLWLVRRRRAALPQAYDRGPVDEGAVEALVERLEQRLAARESALAARERDLQAKIDELRALERTAPQGPGAPRDARRERELAEREAALAERERQLAERVTIVTKRELEVARRAAAPPRAAPPLASAPPPAPPSAAPTAPAAPAAGAGAFNLAALEGLVAERGPAFPDRLEEWRSYLFFLREYAAPDGSLPGSFDWLVQDTFRALLEN